MAIFPSTLIISAKPNLSSLQTELNTDHPDLFIIDNNYSIDEIRALKKFFSLKPYSHLNKLAIIYQAEKLNTESQNALLKTLEEPGPNNYLILTTTIPQALLPTIISRCHIIREKSTQSITKLDLFISPDLNTNLITSEKIAANKDEVLPFLKNQLSAYHQTLPQNPQNADIIKKIILAIDMIESNVDPRSALDYLLLS